MRTKPTDKPRHQGIITDGDKSEQRSRALQALAQAKARDKGKVPVRIPGDPQHTTIMVPRWKNKKKAIENFLRKTKQ